MKNKKLILVVAVLMLAAIGTITYYYWYMNRNYVVTEDARIDGDIYQVSPQVSGKILEIAVEEGQTVRTGDKIARLDDTTLSPGANPNLAVIYSPISGLVVKKVAHVGEVAAPGQPVVMVVDPSKLYITANIEETKLTRVRPGQPVDITLDALPGSKFTGRVERIGRASLSTFSLLPTSNTSGNFTKVVQRVPVKILFDQYPQKYIEVGTNAVVRIHIR
ncbi:HlyD family efflux transporter periplasmic adaptor subunit [Desulfofundulus thermobenzoicus]|uniref:HlyD family efflux transporter periplasmic adaptor subunit n=1 Tax=Desulfofundulus thermobenzoicus TaxID=29376 RepID=A0A6N7IQT9_9FIRM|nr:HlyD family secretion protein [Desulfofundulus thermobenzoicus]MQL51538.1 HlyD family efflux transporter periplasmic adaptor subunit [Desulfofundulus thermobenzoicus]HHW44241.1 HlyD family secretion protein [Desulfotomaculum sp.]